MKRNIRGGRAAGGTGGSSGTASSSGGSYTAIEGSSTLLGCDEQTSLPSRRARGNVYLITVGDSSSAVLKLNSTRIQLIIGRITPEQKNTNISVSAAMSTVQVYEVEFVESKVLSY